MQGCLQLEQRGEEAPVELHAPQLVQDGALQGRRYSLPQSVRTWCAGQPAAW